MEGLDLSVFISYAGSDRYLALEVSRCLEEQRVTVWWDKEQIRAGVLWAPKIERAVANSKALVLLVTANAGKSTYVALELHAAKDHRVPILPLIFEDTSVPDDLRFLIRGVSPLHLRKSDVSERMPEILKQLECLGVLSGRTASNNDERAEQHSVPVLETITRRDGLRTVFIPPGVFHYILPSARAAVRVRIARGFHLTQVPVTVQAYRELMRTDLPLPGTHPARLLSWRAACDYCERAGGRLPTDTEWEYAAAEAAVSSSLGSVAPQPVGSGLPNQKGLYDMAGSVWQWTLDSFPHDHWAELERIAASGGEWESKLPRDNAFGNHYKIVRGGSWVSESGAPAARLRDQRLCDVPYEDVGFRCLFL